MAKVLIITAVRARVGRLVQGAFLRRRRILIGKRGVPMAVLLAFAEYEELLEDLEDLRDMQEAEGEYRRTGGKSLTRAVSSLRGHHRDQMARREKS